MFNDPTTALFWAVLFCEFFVAFGLITYLVADEKRNNRPQ